MIIQNRYKYEVKWENYRSIENTYEPEVNLIEDVPQTIKRFNKYINYQILAKLRGITQVTLDGSCFNLSGEKDKDNNNDNAKII